MKARCEPTNRGLPDVHDVAVHSRIRDHQAAYRATARAIDLAQRHQHRFHVLHVSTGAEIELLIDHQQRITAEVCPHHLLFQVEDYARLGSLVQMNPSIKTAADNAALWQALLGGQIQVVATDHAPHTREEKRQPYPQSPSGLPAVENSLALMLDQVQRGRCSLQQVVHWMCEAPAQVWDLVGKGRIQVGYDADLVLVDLEKSAPVLDEEQQTKCGWSPWHGSWLRGWPVATWVRGHPVFQHGQIDESRSGRKPSSTIAGEVTGRIKLMALAILPNLDADSRGPFLQALLEVGKRIGTLLARPIESASYKI